MIVGAEEYLAAKVKRQPHFELAYGYSFESACLYAASLGLGTVMLAASINRPAFEAAMAVTHDEVMAVASPVGHAAQKRSVRDTLIIPISKSTAFATGEAAGAPLPGRLSAA